MKERSRFYAGRWHGTNDMPVWLSVIIAILLISGAFALVYFFGPPSKRP